MDFLKWTRRQWDRSAAVLCLAAGLIALLLGWLGVSGSTLPTEQIPYLASGAILGLFLLGVGATLWLSADLRDEWRKLEEIHQTMQADQVTRSEPVLPPPAADPEVKPTGNGSAARRRTPMRAGDA